MEALVGMAAVGIGMHCGEEVLSAGPARNQEGHHWLVEGRVRIAELVGGVGVGVGVAGSELGAVVAIAVRGGAHVVGVGAVAAAELAEVVARAVAEVEQGARIAPVVELVHTAVE